MVVFRKYTYSMQGEMFIFRKDNPGAKYLPPFSLGPPFKTTLVYVWMGWGGAGGGGGGRGRRGSNDGPQNKFYRGRKKTVLKTHQYLELS